METHTLKKSWHSIEPSGKWKIDYLVRNNMGPRAFGGFHLMKYKNPFNQTVTYLKGVNDEAKAGWMLDKIQVQLFPDINPEDKLLISWLICHPKVKVKGIKGLDQIVIDSKESTQITLTCLDYIEMEEIDNDDYIDKILGRLSLDGGPQAIGLDKLRYIMAQVGLQYIEPRMLTPTTEKKFLRSKLKTYLRSSLKNAKNVNRAILNLETSKDLYEFKECLRLKVIVLSNGLYKFNNVPLGSSYDGVTLFYGNNPEVQLEVINQLYQYLK